MKLKPYVAPGRAPRQAARAATVEPGTVNHHSQLVVRRGAKSLSDLPGQSIYLLHCNLCGFEYGEVGLRVHARKCPGCSGGVPGLPVSEMDQFSLF